MAHFKLVSTTKASDIIPVNKYVSEKTGLTVIIAEVEGPVVDGYFCLATEAHDDDGLPHTLEHLVFLGSERYPYKGVLDQLANRCMAHGTNAWTDTDHTCYTICTAGDAGMLTLLPIYLDHILYPTLTDEGFITEVHHIDGDGEDAGVVYCEMQGRENSGDSRCELKLIRAMYPGSGYSAETGGIMENLRTSTDNVKVRNFHKKFYRPENVTVILTGQINASDVFASLSIVEDDIIAKREKESQEKSVKPWETIPGPPKYGELKEQWPADIEDCGQVIFGWRGPVLTEPSALKHLTSCAILLRYLCDTAAAPLQKCLVEREDALAGDISYNLTENMASMVKIELSNVPIDKLAKAKEEGWKCLQQVREGNDPIDMQRIKRLLQKQLREGTASLESNPHRTIAFQCIGDCLYSQNENDFISRLNPQNDLLALMEESSDYWLELLRKYFTDDVVTIVGAPSIEMQKTMAEEEKKRIEQQRALLGEKGLAEKAKQLEDAIQFNERPPPAGTLAAVPVPSCDSFNCHTISTWCSKNKCPHFDTDLVPLYVRLHNLKTNFVYINILLDTTKVDDSTRRWLPLLLNGIAECPVRRGDVLIPHEQVISTTEELTVTFHYSVGLDWSSGSVGKFANFIRLKVWCEPKDYEEVVNHVYEVMYKAEITKERLLVFAQRMINEGAMLRRNGNLMTRATLKDYLYSENTNVHWCSLLRQLNFLKQLIEKLNAGGDCADNVLSEARNAFKSSISNAWIHLAADFDRYKLSAEPWKKFGCQNEVIPLEPHFYFDYELLKQSSEGGGFVIGVGGVESCFLMQASAGPSTMEPHTIAPLLVALNYFTQLEGPMWRQIRGSGLSYSYGVRTSLTEGRILLSLYRATNVGAAYSKALAILKEFLNDGEFDEDLFTSARSATLFEIVDGEKSTADVIELSLVDYMQQLPQQYNKELVKAISRVSMSETQKAARQWFPALFDHARSVLSVVCHPSKVHETADTFQKLGIKLEAFESLEASHFNK